MLTQLIKSVGLIKYSLIRLIEYSSFTHFKILYLTDFMFDVQRRGNEGLVGGLKV